MMMIYKSPIYFGGPVDPIKQMDEESKERVIWFWDNYRGSIPIQKVFDPDTDPQLWYCIPGFNGYEISDYGLVRSMKNFNVYEFGNMIRPKITKGEKSFRDAFNDVNRIYELTTNNNVRVYITMEDVWYMAQEYQHVFNPAGYPHITDFVSYTSRNKRQFINFEKVRATRVPNNKKPRSVNREDLSYAHFSVKSDNE